MGEVWLRRIAPRLDSDRGLWLAVFGVCIVIYACTAHWSDPGIDSLSAAWPAWSLAHRGTLDLAGIHGITPGVWFIPVHGAILSNRQIGVVLAGVPANALLGWTGLSAYGAAALTAVLMSAAAVATLAVVVRGFMGTRYALATAAVVGFGTAMWTAASEELWTHSPDALWLSLVLLGLSRRRLLLTGAAFIPAVMTRPHPALAAFAIAGWLALRRRSPRPVVTVAVPAAVGLLAVALANHAVWGHWSLTGGYGQIGYSVASAAGGGSSMFHVVGLNVLGALLSPRCGLVLYTPVVLVAFLGLWRGFRTAPDWAQAALFGGVFYELAQCKINVFTGGSLFFGNRLIIESVMLAAPMLAHCVREWARTRRRVDIAVVFATAAVAMHAIGALLPTPGTSPAYVQPWRDWLLLFWVRNAGPIGELKAVVVVLIALAALKLFADARAARSVSSGARPGSSRLRAGSESAQSLPA